MNKKISVLFGILTASIFSLFCLTFNVKPFRSHALFMWTTVEVDGQQCWYDNSLAESIGDGDYYFYCNANYYYADNGNVRPYEYWGFSFSERSAGSPFVCTNDSGVYTVTNISAIMYIHWGSGNGSTDSFEISGFKYDSVMNQFWYYRNSSWRQCGDNVIFNVHTNIWEMDTGSLDVSFPLPMTGVIGDTMQYHDSNNDTTIDIKTYQFDCVIKNTTRKNYQVCWVIEEDNSVNFNFDWQSSSNALSGINGLGFNGSPAWVHLMNQWYCGINSAETNGILSNSDLYEFLYNSSSIDDDFFQSVYGPCSWSMVPAGSSNTLHACVKNMNLQSGRVYTCKVYAIPTSGRYITNISKPVAQLANVSESNIYNISLDFSEVTCVYSSNFTLEEGYRTPYEADWNGVGIISYDSTGNTQALFNSSLASQKSSGYVDVGYKIDKNSPNLNPYGYSHNSSVSPSYDSSSYSSFMSFLLGFVRSFTSVSGLFTFGLSAIIIIGIIKAVK